MDKKILALLIIVIIVISGFIFAGISSQSKICTLMGCSCENVVGERPCNACEIGDPIFKLGIINVANVCSAKEVILCENNQQVGERIDIDKSKCWYKWQLFGYY